MVSEQTVPDAMALENARILEFLQQHTEGKIAPGDRPAALEVAYQGDSEIPPLLASVHQDSGRVTIYDLRTGQPSYCSANSLPTQIKKLNDQGQRMFSLTPPPGVTPHTGNLRCYLHPDERRPEYDAWGMPLCRKANLLNALERDSHMKGRHPRQWAMLERERERQERAEDRELQRVIARAAIKANPELAAELSTPLDADPVTAGKGPRKK